ncbi:glycosyltransferase [bacterium]|nr:glycosyltransferase [bacterium]
MNIIYVHSGEFPSNSPSLTFTSYTVNSLAKEIDTCYFFIKKNSDKTPEAIFNEVLGLPMEKGLKIRPLKVLLNKRFNSLYFYQVYFQILRLKKTSKIDAIITRNVTFLPLLIKLKSKIECKVFLETHDFFTDLSLRDDINIKKKVKQERLEQKYIPHLNGVFCLTNTQIQLYSKYYPHTKLILARTGLSPLTPSPLSQRRYLGYVGSLDLHKGILNLIKIASLTETKPNIVIIGAKSEEEGDLFLREASKVYDVNKIEVFLWQNKADLHKILDQVKIGFVTLTDTFFNNYLTSPLKIFDYLSKQIPVIGSKLPTIEEVIKDNNNGFLYELGKEEEIAKKIDKLLTDDKLYTEFQAFIEAQTQELTWSKRAKIIKKAIELAKS